MRKISFIIGIVGLALLVSLLIKTPKHIEYLDGLAIGEVVSISGIVEEERKYGYGKILTINEMPVFCECAGNYIGKKVILEGIIESFPQDLRIKAFRIEILN